MTVETTDELEAAAEPRAGDGGWGEHAEAISHRAAGRGPAWMRRHLRRAAAAEERAEKAEKARIEWAEEEATRLRIQASMAAARERGEEVSLRQVMRDGGVVRSHGETIAYFSALGDAQDQQAEARKKRFTQAVRAHLVKLEEHALAAAVDAPPVNVAAAQAAVAMAMQVSPAGCTPAETLALMSAQADLTDALQAAAAQRELAELLDSGGVAAEDGARSEAIRVTAERIRARAASARDQVHPPAASHASSRSLGYEAGWHTRAAQVGEELMPPRDFEHRPSTPQGPAW